LSRIKEEATTSIKARRDHSQDCTTSRYSKTPRSSRRNKKQIIDTDLNEALDRIEDLQNTTDLLSKEKELLLCESQSLNRKIKDLEYEIE